MEDISKAFFGRLSDLSEDQIKRLVMKLLINKVVKEKFNSFKIESTILVYIIPGRRMQAFKDGSVRIAITDVVDTQDRKLEDRLKKSERKAQKLLHQKHNPNNKKLESSPPQDE